MDRRARGVHAPPPLGGDRRTAPGLNPLAHRSPLRSSKRIGTRTSPSTGVAPMRAGWNLQVRTAASALRSSTAWPELRAIFIAAASPAAVTLTRSRTSPSQPFRLASAG